MVTTVIYLSRFYRREGMALAFVKRHALEALKYGSVLWVCFYFIP